MEVLFFVLAVYGSIFIFAYFVVFLLLIIIVPLIIIWEIIKALWIFKGLSKQQKIDLIPGFLFVGYTVGDWYWYFYRCTDWFCDCRLGYRNHHYGDWLKRLS